MNTALTDLTIKEARALLAQRSVSSLELVEATLTRIEETEPLIHAYVRIFADAARREARDVDARVGRGEDGGPLFGIPIGIKDLCYVKGEPTEAGSRALAGFIPDRDATVVRLLRQAGAIVIGKTVTHELAYGVNVPPTRTPWHIDCYPGGSSAGSGAAVAARSAFAAIGTDTGGSIREPAALNGVVGLKPTFGLVSRAGIVPLSASLDHAGPLTRTVYDCALLLQAIAGYDPADSSSIRVPSQDYTAALSGECRGLTVGVERNYLMGSHLWGEVRLAVEHVISEFERLGARVVEVEIPHLDLMSTVGTTILLPDASAYHRSLVRERGSDLDPATRLMLELGALVPATHYVDAQRARTVLREIMRDVFVSHKLDALISPTVPTTTMPMDRVLQPDESGEDPMSAAFHHMVPANITGQPALSIPCGFSTSGMPIGVQLLGKPFDESTLLQLAYAYEQQHQWATVTPPFTRV